MKASVSRRDFLKLAGAAAATAAIVKSPLAKLAPHTDLGNGYISSEPIYVGLGSKVPGGMTEVEGSGYARQEITFKEVDGALVSEGQVPFPQATGSWGVVNVAGVFLGNKLIATSNFWRGDTFINDGDTAMIEDMEVRREL